MDAIQRRLEYIDRQLYYQNLFFEKPAFDRPLVFCAVGLTAGIALQQVLVLPIAPWLVLLSLSICAAITISLLRKKIPPYYTEGLSLLVLLCFVCLGGIRLISFKKLPSNDVSRLIGGRRTLATIRGRILTPPFVNKNKNWQFGRFGHSDPTSSFYLKLTEIECETGWAKAAGVVRVQVNEPVLDLKTGDFIQAYCWLERFKAATNPGEFDIAKYLERHNIFVSATVPSTEGIEPLKDNSPDVLGRLKNWLQYRAAQALSCQLEVRDENYGLLEALLLGYRGDIDQETYLAFRRTGLLHFISLSGLHFGILLWVIWSLCKYAGLKKRIRSLVCICMTVIFLLIVPPRAPTLRAAVIALFFCLSFLLKRRADLLNTLCLSAVVLLLYRPTQLFEAGWQLSFAAVLGILLFAGRLDQFIHSNTGRIFCPDAGEKNGLRRFLKILANKVILLFSVGVSAWLGAAGILLYHFYRITPLASLWTVLVYPFVLLILSAGFLKLILYFVFPSLASALSYLLILLAAVLIWLVRLIASFDVSAILIGKVSVGLVGFYYLLLAFWRFAYLKRPPVKKAVVLAGVIFLVFRLGDVKWHRCFRDDLTLHCFNVGHGQAIVVELAGGQNLLFDAGSMYRKDIGRRIVLPFLNYRGIDRLDYVVISHNDTDHINGIAEIITGCSVDKVCANDAFFKMADKWKTAEFLEDYLYKKGQKLTAAGPGLDVKVPTGIKFIWPDRKTTKGLELSDNDGSLVTLITFAGRKILLCSDIENLAQQKILELYPDLKADIVVLPHHGSANTLAPEFISAINPKVALSSCGKAQFAKQQLKGFQSVHRRLFTYKDGAVTVTIDPAGRMSLLGRH